MIDRFVSECSALFRLLGVMAWVAASFFLMLKLGFVLHHDPQPAPIDSKPLTAAALLVFVAGTSAAAFSALHFLRNAAANAQNKREAQANSLRHADARRLRVAELAADPARAQYAPLVERGEDWSDENIAYYENPNLTITCPHLQPIERAMRQAGIPLRRYRESDVTAECQIDLPALQQAFGIVPPVRYAEFYQGERDYQDHPTAFLICDEHKSLIHTLHPDKSRRDTPQFPA